MPTYRNIYLITVILLKCIYISNKELTLDLFIVHFIDPLLCENFIHNYYAWMCHYKCFQIKYLVGKKNIKQAIY